MSAGSTLRCTEADKGIVGNEMQWLLLRDRELQAVGGPSLGTEPKCHTGLHIAGLSAADRAGLKGVTLSTNSSDETD